MQTARLITLILAALGLAARRSSGLGRAAGRLCAAEYGHVAASAAWFAGYVLLQVSVLRSADRVSPAT
jgi:hypothetical protein